jgi:uncharacterized protein
MLRVSNAARFAALLLATAISMATVPASAADQQAAPQGNAVIASGTGESANMSQDHLKAIFFDAARQGRNDLLSGLIQSGMKPDVRDPHGYTALILAAYSGQASSVDLLIQKGANPCATDAHGNSSLMGVAFKGETGILQRLIAAHCDVNARNDAGQTALMMAALFGRTDAVKMLLANGADRSIQDLQGHTAEILAQQQANPQMVALLQQPAKAP